MHFLEISVDRPSRLATTLDNCAGLSLSLPLEWGRLTGTPPSLSIRQINAMVNFDPISSKGVVMKGGEPSPHMTGKIGELPGDIISPHWQG